MALELIKLAIALVPMLVAGVLRGITGFGLLLVATPLLFLLFDPKLVIASLAVPGILTNLTIFYRDGIPWAEFADEKVTFLAGAVGAMVGVGGLVVLNSRDIFVLVAGYILLYLVLKRVGDVASKLSTRRGMDVIAGGSGGLLGGTVGLSGPPIVTYLHAKAFSKRTFVGLLASYFLMLAIVRIPSMYVTGLFGINELLLGAAFTVPAVVGTYVGAGFRPNVPQDWFEFVVEGFLLVVAVKLVLDGFSVTLY